MSLRYRYFKVLVLKTAISDFEVKEPAIILEFHLLLLQLCYGLLLFIAEGPSNHAVSPDLPNLPVKCSEFALLLCLELLLVGLLPEGDEVPLHLQHVVPVGRQRRTLQLLQDTLQLGVQLFHLVVDLFLVLHDFLLMISSVLPILATIHPRQFRCESIIEFSCGLLHNLMKLWRFLLL